MAIGLVGSALFAMLVPVAGMPQVMFALFGICLALATPPISALQAEALNSENRATGLGIY